MTTDARHARQEPRLTPAQIRDAGLPAARFGRGYARQAVRALLAAIADHVQDLEQEIGAARQTIRQREREIEQRRYGVALPSAGRCEPAIDEQILRWQIEAQRYSDELTATARVQAAEIVGEARQQAGRVLAEQSPDGHRADAAEIARLRRTATVIQYWLKEIRRQVDAADDSVSAEIAGNAWADPA